MSKNRTEKDLLHIMGEIHQIMDLNWDNFISYEKVMEWNINELKNIEGVTNLKILHTNTHCRFLTKIPPKKSFNIHWHDCTEVCTVLAGTLADKEKAGIFTIGTKCYYKPFEKHIPYNLSETENLYLLVDFYK